MYVFESRCTKQVWKQMNSSLCDERGEENREKKERGADSLHSCFGILLEVCIVYACE